MIKARRLFLVPSLSAFLLLIPLIGIFLTLFVVFCWYLRNQEDIHLYLKGGEYRMNELDKQTLQDFK